jgi:hypothetical protein
VHNNNQVDSHEVDGVKNTFPFEFELTPLLTRNNNEGVRKSHLIMVTESKSNDSFDQRELVVGVSTNNVFDEDLHEVPDRFINQTPWLINRLARWIFLRSSSVHPVVNH